MIDVIFASQTGTAEDVALELGLIFKQGGWNARIRSTQKLTLNDLKKVEIAFFLVSTTGDGEPPDSMIRIWGELLDKSLPQDMLKMKFSVFGFGDSKYGDYFNVMARKVEKRLSMLGGKIVAERGLGDEQDTMGYRN